MDIPSDVRAESVFNPLLFVAEIMENGGPFGKFRFFQLPKVLGLFRRLVKISLNTMG
jgi:hypothetical protein